MVEIIHGISVFVAIAVGGILLLCLNHLYDGAVNELRKEYPDVWRETGSLLPWHQETLAESLRHGNSLIRIIDQELLKIFAYPYSVKIFPVTKTKFSRSQHFPA